MLSERLNIFVGNEVLMVLIKRIGDRIIGRNAPKWKFYHQKDIFPFPVAVSAGSGVPALLRFHV